MSSVPETITITKCPVRLLPTDVVSFVAEEYKKGTLTQLIAKALTNKGYYNSEGNPFTVSDVSIIAQKAGLPVRNPYRVKKSSKKAKQTKTRQGEFKIEASAKSEMVPNTNMIKAITSSNLSSTVKLKLITDLVNNQ